VRLPVVLDVGQVRPARLVGGVGVVALADDLAARVDDPLTLLVVAARALPHFDVHGALADLVHRATVVEDAEAVAARHERDGFFVVVQAAAVLDGLDVLLVHAEPLGHARDVDVVTLGNPVATTDALVAARAVVEEPERRAHAHGDVTGRQVLEETSLLLLDLLRCREHHLGHDALVLLRVPEEAVGLADERVPVDLDEGRAADGAPLFRVELRHLPVRDLADVGEDLVRQLRVVAVARLARGRAHLEVGVDTENLRHGGVHARTDEVHLIANLVVVRLVHVVLERHDATVREPEAVLAAPERHARDPELLQRETLGAALTPTHAGLDHAEKV